jgi:TusA-related sulfurtransferase
MTEAAGANAFSSLPLLPELLAVVARDPAAAVDVPAWCRMKAQDYVGADAADDGSPRYVVRRLA